MSYGVRNLTHHTSSEHPELLEPGRRLTVRVQLNGMAQSFPAGHRLRLSLSTTYWPVVWPSPAPVRLTVFPGESALVLPVRPVGVDDGEPAPAFGPPEGAPPISVTQLLPVEHDWTVTRNMVDLSGALNVLKDLGVVRFDTIDLTVTRRAHERYTFAGDDFCSVRGETDWTMGFARGDWRVRTRTRTVLTSTPTDFHVLAELDAYEGELRVAAKTWSTTIPRDFL
ncbi:CocE/NonD family hydrolase C-terminal non-catalytic domain-containing protein [Georgenia sp. SUBG003]|uniref:CocE/NonD family hydrolase C-terminal non-catalytic domain-containing protein n=1 Tax=Georgenia sp. SUBG003 TaxID=1497974 RepID=UPI0004D675AE|nr:hypothetical protein DA06_08695 [Georgenia sp. SUBG003]